MIKSLIILMRTQRQKTSTLRICTSYHLSTAESPTPNARDMLVGSPDGEFDTWWGPRTYDLWPTLDITGSAKFSRSQGTAKNWDCDWTAINVLPAVTNTWRSELLTCSACHHYVITGRHSNESVRASSWSSYKMLSLKYPTKKSPIFWQFLHLCIYLSIHPSN